MASLRKIRRKIKSVKSTQRITKAVKICPPVVWRMAAVSFLFLLSYPCRAFADLENVRALKNQINNFSLSVTVSLEPQEKYLTVYGLRSLDLHVSPTLREPASVWPDGQPVSADAPISVETAERLMDVLVKANFFANARKYHSPRVNEPYSPAPKDSALYKPQGVAHSQSEIKLVFFDDDWYTYFVRFYEPGKETMDMLKKFRPVLNGRSLVLLNQILSTAQRGMPSVEKSGE